MSAERKPRKSVTWNAERGHYHWTVTLPSGVELSGHAATEDQARRDMHADWRVRGDQPRFVGPRTRRGNIQPPAAT